MITLNFLSNMKVIPGIVCVRKGVVGKEIGAALTVLSCTECCCSDHYRHPFHCVKVWCGQYFTPSLLSVAGVVLHLGHGGHPCPNVIHPQDDTWVDDPDDSSEEDVDDPSLADPTAPPTFNDILSSLGHGNEQSHRKKRYDAYGNPHITIVNQSSIHHLTIQCCCCNGHLPIHHQLLQISLYPATQISPRTAFTFTLLDDFCLMNLECKVSTNGFYSYLHCVTLFPHTQPMNATILLKH
jgi:hypothetical protein